jgi:acyl-CoA thioesterase-1
MRIGLGVAMVAAVACGTAKDTRGTDSAVHLRPEPSGAGAAAVGSQPRPPLGRSDRGEVLIVGTSLTAGYGLDDPSDAYPSVLQRISDSAGYRIGIQNAGLSGETSAGALRRIEWLLRSEYDVVVIETGANDGLRGLNIDSTRANLRGIIRRVKTALPKARIGLVQMEAPPNLGGIYTRRFHESFELVAQEEGVALFPFLLDGVAGDSEFNQRDGIHPNEEGALRVAANVWRALEPLVSGYR